MTHSNAQIPQILERMQYEVKPNVIVNYEKKFQQVLQVTQFWSKPERETIEMIQAALSSGTSEDYVGMHIGLYYTVLVDKSLAKRAFFALLATSRDSLSCVITEMNRTLGEFWPKLLLDCKKQLMWLFCELVTHNQHADAVINHLCKRMANGDLSSTNIWLIEYMVNFFSVPNHLRWLESRPAVNPPPLALLVFTFLRLIPDHFPAKAAAPGTEMSAADQQKLAELRAKEIRFTISILRSNWRHCSLIGRELVRVLLDLVKIPEFHALWTDLLHQPRVIAGCKGLKALMKAHSNTGIIAHSVPHDAEQWIKFLIRQVKVSNCNHYLDWFQKRFFATPESQSLRALLIRFVVVNVSPRTDASAHELIGRHHVVLWLVSNCTPATRVASCRLAIFFDWLLGDWNRCDDVVRLFEPGFFIFLQCPAINTAPLITFLLDLLHEFHPPFSSEIRNSIIQVIKIVRSKHQEDLAPLFKNPELDPLDRQRLENDLAELAASVAAGPARLSAGSGPQLPQQQLPVPQQQQPQPQPQLTQSADSTGRARAASLPSVPQARRSGELTPPTEYFDSVTDIVPCSGPFVRRARRNDSVGSAQFSDEGDSAPTTLDDLRRAFTNYNIRFLYKYREVDVDRLLEGMDESISEHLQAIQKSIVDNVDPEEASDIQNAAIDNLVSSVTMAGIDEETRHNAAAVLCQLYLPTFEAKLLPSDPNEDSLLQSISSTLFTLLRYYIPSSDSQEMDSDSCSFLAHMHACQPRVGYYLLYCLKLSSSHSPNCDWNAVYRQFVSALSRLPGEYQQEWTADNNVGRVLLKHAELAASDDPDLFVFLLPDIVEQFPDHTKSNTAFIRLIVSTVDCKQLRDIICQVLQGHMQLLDGANFQECLEDSLTWESIEQIFLWQILNAHEIPTERFLPFLALLNYKDHAEALFNLLLMFKLEKPNEELLKAVLERSINPKEHFSVSILHFWADRDQERLATLLDRFLTDKFRDKKRVKPGKTKEFPPLDRILGHLDHMRLVCKKNDILQSGTLQSALQHVHSNGSVTDDLRSRYMDLFALALELDLPGGSHTASGGPAVPTPLSSGAPTSAALDAASERSRSLRNVAARKAAEAQRRQEGPLGGGTREKRRHGGGSGASAGPSEKGSSESEEEEETMPPRGKKRRAAGLLSGLNQEIFDDEA